MLISLKLFSKNKKQEVTQISEPKQEYKYPQVELEYVGDCSPTTTKTVGSLRSYNEIGEMQLRAMSKL